MLSPFQLFKSLLTRGSEVTTVWPLLASGSMVSVAAGYAAWMTELLTPYSPLSWVAAGLVGALLFAMILWLVVTSRNKLAIIRLQRKFERVETNINPMEKQFNLRRIKISDLAFNSNTVVEGKTFVDCELVGPLNILLAASKPGASSMASCSFSSTVGVIIDADAAIPRESAVAFLDCTFLRCRIYSVIIFLPRERAGYIAKSIEGFHWLNRSSLPPQTSI